MWLVFVENRNNKNALISVLKTQRSVKKLISKLTKSLIETGSQKLKRHQMYNFILHSCTCPNGNRWERKALLYTLQCSLYSPTLKRHKLEVSLLPGSRRHFRLSLPQSLTPEMFPTMQNINTVLVCLNKDKTVLYCTVCTFWHAKQTA